MLFPRHLVALATLVAAGPSQAQVLISELSFGHAGRLGADDGKIPHFTVTGQPQQPQLLSNKIILTPMDPGNQRSSIWSDSPLTRSTWVADVDFRASGPDRAGGNLNIWFARRGKEEVGTNSVYTAGKFDGLALVIDTHGGSGGMIRGFLNDGTVDYVSQHNVDRLAFGQCNYFYRNLGRPSQIKLRQTASSFKVEIDGRTCFETDKVSLPPGYYFGITAATPETPDSFEIFKLVVMSDSTVSGDNNQFQYNSRQHQPDNNQGQKAQENKNDDFGNAIPDQSADIFQTSKEQFADLHNRLQAATHQISGVYNAVSKHHQMDEVRHEEMKKAFDSLRHELAALRQIGDLQSKIRELESEIHSMHHDMRQKLDAHGESFETNLRNHHRSLSAALSDSIPGHGKLMVFFVGTQIVLVAGYVVYKRRRASSPKKYL
ncbi:legume-like lectin family protein [Metarhizium robertsii]|uniref:Legume-like lectin n=2 Tax=Metarhizium robertsii TaxID=568076 RepID=E9F9J9_METRA|nr:Legume-like lectin [Metarhizium robertsii ARSEF 23]EFY95652.1 Legume-like lectin [Metarhizium robertsii ARSEF 23]EXU97279.1 legume-like lectin family protein [Metarhizium robertsii]